MNPIRQDCWRFRAAAWLACAHMFLLLASGCNRTPETHAPFVVTIPPLKLILQEITGAPDSVACILPPGASPHTFELRPSTARTLEGARAVFYADDSIDGWAANLAPGRLYPLFPMVPPAMRLPYEAMEDHVVREEDGHHGAAGSHNAHFWSDPLVVREIVPGLVEVLADVDPENAARYRENGEAFQTALTELDKSLAPIRPADEHYALVAFHPSWRYFFHRYGIHVTAYVEPFPGKEPTPRTLQALQEALVRHERRIILSEVQLPAKPAEVLAEAVGASVTVVDPLGGADGLNTYGDFLRYNAAQLRKVLP